MAKRPLPSPETLRQLLRYEPETGKLFWRERPRSMFSSERIYLSWNAKLSGKEAFTSLTSDGYHNGAIYGRIYRAHRVIWAIVHGVWPEHEIDHVNLIKSDNRICNLREATHSENLCNQTIRADNSSGYQGVGWHKRVGKFQARIGIPGKRISLGYYDTAEAAYEAYCEAAERLHGEFARVV